jgi:hypothetical protein
MFNSNAAATSLESYTAKGPLTAKDGSRSHLGDLADYPLSSGSNSLACKSTLNGAMHR